jgi:hypothetical protein
LTLLAIAQSLNDDARVTNWLAAQIALLAYKVAPRKGKCGDSLFRARRCRWPD